MQPKPMSARLGPLLGFLASVGLLTGCSGTPPASSPTDTITVTAQIGERSIDLVPGQPSTPVVVEPGTRTEATLTGFRGTLSGVDSGSGISASADPTTGKVTIDVTAASPGATGEVTIHVVLPGGQSAVYIISLQISGAPPIPVTVVGQTITLAPGVPSAPVALDAGLQSVAVFPVPQGATVSQPISSTPYFTASLDPATGGIALAVAADAAPAHTGTITVSVTFRHGQTAEYTLSVAVIGAPPVALLLNGQEVTLAHAVPSAPVTLYRGTTTVVPFPIPPGTVWTEPDGLPEQVRASVNPQTGQLTIAVAERAGQGIHTMALRFRLSNGESATYLLTISVPHTQGGIAGSGIGP